MGIATITELDDRLRELEEDTCWRCGTEWTSEDAPRTTSYSKPAALPVAVAHKKAA